MLDKLLGTYVPDTGGALWLGLLVCFVLVGDFRRVFAPRNVALLGLLAMAPFLNDIGRWGYDEHPRLAPLWWTGIFLITAGHTIWAFVLARRDREPWVPNLPRRGLVMLVGLLLAMNVAMTIGKRPEDAGRYISLGTQRWLETGILPYADPQLIGPSSPAFGAASTYGPFLYIAHIPTQLLLDGRPNPADAVVRSGAYQRPGTLGTKVVTLAFHLAGLWALYAILAPLAGVDVALAGVALYMAMPYLAGLEASHGSISGLRFISHIAPSALMLVAMATVARPFLSGLAFAAAGGALFYPVFMFPAWLAWRIWRKDRPLRFAAGAVVGGIALLAVVIAFTPANSWLHAVKIFLHAIIEHQEGHGLHQYGGSVFGFWGTHPRLMAFWHQPLFGGTPFTQPAFLGFLAIAGAACFWARGRGIIALAALTAAIGAAVQLWKTHGGGTYIEWYLPFLIIALVLGADSVASTRQVRRASTPPPEGATPQ